jgi:hypothetical protein
MGSQTIENKYGWTLMVSVSLPHLLNVGKNV